MIETLDNDHMDMLLKTQMIGRIGCHAKDRTYVVPISYAYDDGFIYGHTNDGMKLRMMREAPEVCFEVDSIRDFGNWRSVIAWGTFEELEGQEAAAALDLLIQRLSATISQREHTPPAEIDMEALAHGLRLEAKKGVTYRIRIKEKSGRHEVPPPHQRS